MKHCWRSTKYNIQTTLIVRQEAQLSLTDRAKLCTLHIPVCAKNSLSRPALAKDYLPTKFQVLIS